MGEYRSHDHRQLLSRASVGQGVVQRFTCAGRRSRSGVLANGARPYGVALDADPSGAGRRYASSTALASKISKRQCGTARGGLPLVVRGAAIAGDERIPAFADSLAACLQAPEPADCPLLTSERFVPVARRTPAQSSAAGESRFTCRVGLPWQFEDEVVLESRESRERRVPGCSPFQKSGWPRRSPTQSQTALSRSDQLESLCAGCQGAVWRSDRTRWIRPNQLRTKRSPINNWGVRGVQNAGIADVRAMASTLNSSRPTGSVGSWTDPPSLSLTSRAVSSSAMSRASGGSGRADRAWSPRGCRRRGRPRALRGGRAARESFRSGRGRRARTRYLACPGAGSVVMGVGRSVGSILAT